MADGHVPTRMCRICRTKKPQSQLQRWTNSGSGWVADGPKRAPGRGVYTCSEHCAEILTTKFGKK